MQDSKNVTGFVLIVVGGLSAIKPELFLRWKTFFAKKIYGADFRPSKKTEKIQRSLGIAFFILGLLVLTGAIP